MSWRNRRRKKSRGLGNPRSGGGGKMTTFEAWKGRESLVFSSSEGIAHWREEGEVEQESERLYSIEAETWDAAMAEHYKRQGLDNSAFTIEGGGGYGLSSDSLDVIPLVDGKLDAARSVTHLASDAEPDWGGKCILCGQSPTVPATGMCGPCTFGEADTDGGNW
jgi:hypothetical protein